MVSCHCQLEQIFESLGKIVSMRDCLDRVDCGLVCGVIFIMLADCGLQPGLNEKKGKEVAKACVYSFSLLLTVDGAGCLHPSCTDFPAEVNLWGLETWLSS